MAISEQAAIFFAFMQSYVDSSPPGREVTAVLKTDILSCHHHRGEMTCKWSLENRGALYDTAPRLASILVHKILYQSTILSSIQREHKREALKPSKDGHLNINCSSMKWT